MGPGCARHADVTPLTLFWTLGRRDEQWKTKEALPPARGEEALAEENLDEDSSPEQVQWYYRQTRGSSPFESSRDSRKVKVPRPRSVLPTLGVARSAAKGRARRLRTMATIHRRLSSVPRRIPALHSRRSRSSRGLRVAPSRHGVR